MDFFQGSSPPNFISFCLGNQNENESQIRTNTAKCISDESVQVSTLATTPNFAQSLIPSPPPFPPIRPPMSHSSTGSSVDVNAYAEERVRLHEEIRQIVDQQNRDQIAEESDPVEEEGEDRQTKTGILPRTDTTLPVFRTSTPTPETDEVTAESNLTQLETGLKVASTSRTTLPELLPKDDPVIETSVASFLRAGTDEGSSSCDAPGEKLR